MKELANIFNFAKRDVINLWMYLSPSAPGEIMSSPGYKVKRYFSWRVTAI